MCEISLGGFVRHCHMTCGQILEMERSIPTNQSKSNRRWISTLNDLSEELHSVHFKICSEHSRLYIEPFEHLFPKTLRGKKVKSRDKEVQKGQE